VQQRGGGECVHSVCPEWDLFHGGLTCSQDYTILLWNNNHVSKFSPQFKLQYDRLIQTFCCWCVMSCVYLKQVTKLTYFFNIWCCTGLQNYITCHYTDIICNEIKSTEVELPVVVLSVKSLSHSSVKVWPKLCPLGHGSSIRYNRNIGN